VRGSRALSREDLGLSGSVLQRTDDELLQGGLVFIYSQLMTKMWDIRRREMHIQSEREKKEKDWRQDFSTVCMNK
jgi:hypothetical protein